MREVFDHLGGNGDAVVHQIADEFGPLGSSRAGVSPTFPRATIVVSHPSAALCDQVRDAVLPTADLLAERKNVPMAPEERNAVINRALATFSRQTLRDIMNGEPIAIERVQLALDHAIDRLAANRFAWAIMRLGGDLDPDPATTIAMADDTLARRSANDQAPSRRIWPDMVASLVDAIARIAKQETMPPLLTLPESAENRVTVQRSRRPRRKGRS